MSFANTHYFIHAIVGIFLIIITLFWLNSKFFSWVKSYWFFDRTWANRISTFMYTLSLFLMMLSLLDLRGPEKKIRTSLPDQRTIILLDASTSMLAEDVRPSRFVKSLQIARHFVKGAAGHQISIVLFSDIQKRLIPFTDDIDLIDSRLAALEKTNSVNGSSNISQAIAEAVHYFEADSSDDSQGGNMLVFTDAEESEGAFDGKIPSNINLAVVGVGTAKGGNIPLRWEDGSFRGYKTFKGEPVVTKLDESYIRKLGKNVKNFKFWIANSYSLPTEEIMNFFRGTYMKKQNLGDVRVRPVFSHYILIPAILLYCLSVLIGRFALFKTAQNLLIISFLGLSIGKSFAEDKALMPSPEITKDLEVIKEGKADRTFTLKAAEKILRSKDPKKAVELYSEYAKKDDEEEVRFNQATALLKDNQLKEAMPIFQDLLRNSKNESLKKKVRSNLAHHLKKKEEDKKKEEQKDNKKDEKKDEQDKQQSPKEGEDKNKKDGKDDKKDGKKDNPDSKNQKNDRDGQNDKDKKDGKEGQQQESKGQKEEQKKRPDASGKLGSERENKKEEKKDGKEKDREKKKSEGEGEEKEDQQPQGPSTLDEKEKGIEQKRRMVKTPAMIKQILSDDRELQKKMMDTSTSERGDQKQKRDW